MTVFRSDIAQAIEETLDEVITDKTDGVEAKAVFPKWMKVGRMTKAIKDDLEVGGPGLLHEKPEGQDTAMGNIVEGYITRYLSRTFGRRIAITEEAIEDNEYDRVLNATGRLKRGAWKTFDYEATKVLIRGFNTAFPGGDGLPLWSASHTLPHGGVFSNLFATPMSPSRAAFVVGRALTAKYPSQDGLIEGEEIEKVVCPVEQQSEWEMLTMSPKAPEPGEFNAINVLERANITVVPVKYWTTTTTNWAFITGCPYGIQFLWRRKLKSASWVENAATIMQYQVTARFATGWSDPRSTLGSNA